MLLRSCWHGVVRRWGSLQIELRGEYSVERLFSFRDFSAGTSVTRAIAIVAVTPLPCLLMVIGPDLLPLEAPERGLAHSHMFWVRTLISCWFSLLALLIQCHGFVPALPVTTAHILGVAAIGALGTIAYGVALTHSIGFPVPFMINLTAPCSILVIGIASALYLRKHLQETPASRAKLKQLGYVAVIQMSFGYVYPAYTTAFYTLSGVPQTLFALLLPVMKLTAKNWINSAVSHREDAKAEFVNFNVEVFHTMFLACCLQGSTSYATTLLIMAIDVVQACISLHDVNGVLNSLHICFDQAADAASGVQISELDEQESTERLANAAASRATTTTLNYLDAAIFLLERDQSILHNAAIRLRSHTQSNLGTRTRSVFPDKIQRRGLEPRNGPTDQQGIGTPQLDRTLSQPPVVRPNALLQLLPRSNSVTPLERPRAVAATGVHGERSRKRVWAVSTRLSESDKRVLLSMSDTHRLEFVQKVLKALHMTEFLLVVEFTEVMIPIVYSTWFVVALVLPPRNCLDRDRDDVKSNRACVPISMSIQASTGSRRTTS